MLFHVLRAYSEFANVFKDVLKLSVIPRYRFSEDNCLILVKMPSVISSYFVYYFAWDSSGAWVPQRTSQRIPPERVWGINSSYVVYQNKNGETIANYVLYQNKK